MDPKDLTIRNCSEQIRALFPSGATTDEITYTLTLDGDDLILQAENVAQEQVRRIRYVPIEIF